MKEGSIRQPVQLIDEDLDAVAGGFSIDINFSDVDQFIKQVQLAGFANDQSQAAANVSSVTQLNA